MKKNKAKWVKCEKCNIKYEFFEPDPNVMTPFTELYERLPCPLCREKESEKSQRRMRKDIQMYSDKRELEIKASAYDNMVDFMRFFKEYDRLVKEVE